MRDCASRCLCLQESNGGTLSSPWLPVVTFHPEASRDSGRKQTENEEKKKGQLRAYTAMRRKHCVSLPTFGAVAIILSV